MDSRARVDCDQWLDVPGLATDHQSVKQVQVEERRNEEKVEELEAYLPSAVRCDIKA